MITSRINSAVVASLPQQTPQQAFSGQTFRALLSALSQPGARIERTPAPEFLATTVPSVCRLPLALASHGTPIAVPGVDDTGAHAIATATGAELTDPACAELIAFVRAPRPGELLDIARGSATEPERGASVAISVAGLRTLTSHEPAIADNERHLRISGPGVDGSVSVAVEGGTTVLDTVLRDRRTACQKQPAGIELWLFDPTGNVLGIPRSSTITWEH
ncbi:phosphonate C-P lyase system protein PhnH [Nocardia sp. NPDC004711]